MVLKSIYHVCVAYLPHERDSRWHTAVSAFYKKADTIHSSLVYISLAQGHTLATVQNLEIA